MSPLVTVYIASFNYGRYIEQAIESVLTQTLKDFELIIIDDGSTDHSREIIERYKFRPGVRPIFQQNRGLTITNNIALRASRGRYIMRLDADDWLDPYAIEILSGILERNPDVGLVFPDYYLVDIEGNIIEQIKRHNFNSVSLLDQPAHGACTMIRTDCLRQVGGYDESFRCQDGFDLWIRFVDQFTVRNINLPLFFYRQHGASLSRDENHILLTRSEILRKRSDRAGNNLKVLAVIATRGPSIDPNSQALKRLGDKLLLDWTLQAALKADRVSKVVLSTPDPDVTRHCKQYYDKELLVISRPTSLAATNTSLNATLAHALEAVETQDLYFDAVLQLSVESPFRTDRHLNTMIYVMEQFDTDIVISVRTETDIFYRHNGHGLVSLNENNGLRLEREEMFREVGSMRLTRREFVLQKTTNLPKIGHMILDQHASLRLDSQFNWEIAESLMKKPISDTSSREVLLQRERKI